MNGDINEPTEISAEYHERMKTRRTLLKTIEDSVDGLSVASNLDLCNQPQLGVALNSLPKWLELGW